MADQPQMKKTCVETLEEIYLYIDGERLTEERRTVIRSHLEECPPCGHAFEFEAELRSVISQRCRDTVPDELRRRITEALGRADTER